MWVSRKKWEALEKKVADLERKVQDQPSEITKIVLQQLSAELKETIREFHY